MNKCAEKNSKNKTSCVDDDDKLLEQCIKENDKCFHTKCEKSIRVIRLNCQFCNNFFCTSHILPEIHGCGNAARKSASAAKPKKTLKEEDKEMLEKKMSQKLNKMMKDRKKKAGK